MIENLKIYPFFTSKGSLSLRVKVFTEHGEYQASIPAGTSKGKHEVKELSFRKISLVFPKIRKKIVGHHESLSRVDGILEEIDGKNNFENIGGNLSLGISVAVAKAEHRDKLWRMKGLKNMFPITLSNIIGGGSHGGRTEWQEFLVLPFKVKAPIEAIRNVIDVWSLAKEELQKKGLLLGKNIENAWISKLDNLKTLDFLANISHDFGLKLGIDFAASSFWNGKKYEYKSMNKNLGPEQQFDLIKELAEQYKLFYLEDPFHEDDFDSFSTLNSELKSCFVVGDDLYVTNLKRLEEGAGKRSSNAAIIKPNQAGTLSRTQAFLDFARRRRITPVVSHRSGETEDTWLADLAVAWKSPIIKIGALNPDLPKNNRLLELWEEIPRPEMAKLPL